MSEDRVVERPTLKQLRRRKLKTQQALANSSGVARGTIASIESGRRPGLDSIGKLAIALDIAPEAIDWPGNPLGLTQ